MSEDRHVSIKPRLPLFWQAIYPEHVRELRVPICRDCGNLIKVSSYDSIVCPNTLAVVPTEEEILATDPNLNAGQVAELLERQTTYHTCGSRNISFDPEHGALAIPMRYGVLNEFDEDGNEPLNFRFLPTDGLQAFGLIDPIVDPPTMYMINLNTGTIEVGNIHTGKAIPLGVGIEFPTRSGMNVVPISTVLERYGQGGDLIHYKHANISGMGSISVIGREAVIDRFDLDPGSQQITNIVVGYKCRIPDWVCQVKINVDCGSHIPFITTKATRIEE